MTRRVILEFDAFGQDPLAKTVLDKILAIRNYTSFTVTKREEANPQLIAYEKYGSVEFHWVVLYYNGIGNSFDLQSGRQILIPDPADVKQVIAAESRVRKPTTAARTLSI